MTIVIIIVFVVVVVVVVVVDHIVGFCSISLFINQVNFHS